MSFREEAIHYGDYYGFAGPNTVSVKGNSEPTKKICACGKELDNFSIAWSVGWTPSNSNMTHWVFYCNNCAYERGYINEERYKQNNN